MTTVAEKKAFVGGKWQTEVDLVDFIKSIILSFYMFHPYTLYQITLISHSKKGKIIPY